MYGICMEYVWICMEYVWNMYGICMRLLTCMPSKSSWGCVRFEVVGLPEQMNLLATQQLNG
jgi:hypothetical protein